MRVRHSLVVLLVGTLDAVVAAAVVVVAAAENCWCTALMYVGSVVESSAANTTRHGRTAKLRYQPSPYFQAKTKRNS